MKYILFLGLLFSAHFASAQAKPKAPPAPLAELPKLISTMGLPYNVINDSLVVIPYGGENVKDFKVIIQQASDLYIIFTNLSECLPGKLDDSRNKYLLQRNADYDMIKIGLSEDVYYVRADIFRKGLTSPTLKRVITQVANVTNIIGGDLK